MRRDHDDATTSTVDISSATVTGGPLIVNHPFEFTIQGPTAINGITVSAGAQHWFSPYSFSFDYPGGNVLVGIQVTAKMSSVGGWGYSVTGMNVGNPNPHVPVDPTMPEEKAS